MTDDEIGALEEMPAGELALEYENAIIDLANCSGQNLERVREIRRIVVRRLKAAE
jgi:hypothetical protein